MSGSGHHVILWEFIVRAGYEETFRDTYGPEGDWAKLFAKEAAYVGTELFRDDTNARRYVTVDRWTSPEDFARFRREYAAEYEALDARCEPWTETETRLGTFVSS